ncbi:DUF4333 domain-containing protein [Streptomyces sp. 6N223]|uniref:DUF4333 domain-containing protein n=1 Tax=Streptomyces sp. 6N223 TaxID=3457412 RepID=UPI003FD053F2
MRQIRRNLAVSGMTLAALSLLLSTGCSGSDPVVEREEVEQQSLATLEEQYGQGAPKDVTCHEDLPAEVGATIRCEVTGEGPTYGATVTTTSVDGDDTQFEIQIDETPME